MQKIKNKVIPLAERQYNLTELIQKLAVLRREHVAHTRIYLCNETNINRARMSHYETATLDCPCTIYPPAHRALDAIFERELGETIIRMEVAVV